MQQQTFHNCALAEAINLLITSSLMRAASTQLGLRIFFCLSLNDFHINESRVLPASKEAYLLMFANTC